MLNENITKVLIRFFFCCYHIDTSPRSIFFTQRSCVSFTSYFPFCQPTLTIEVDTYVRLIFALSEIGSRHRAMFYLVHIRTWSGSMEDDGRDNTLHLEHLRPSMCMRRSVFSLSSSLLLFQLFISSTRPTHPFLPENAPKHPPSSSTVPSPSAPPSYPETVTESKLLRWGCVYEFLSTGGR
jgi:hypothetical protein